MLAPGDEASASRPALRLRSALERSFRVGGHPRPRRRERSASRSSPSTRRTPIGLLQRADVAMYEAKRTRTGHEVYLARARPAQPRPAGAARRAARRRSTAAQLVLHYQPKAELATGAVAAWRRWCAGQHPRRGLLMPGDFLPLAEQTGLIALADGVRARPRAGGDRRAPARRARPRSRGQPRARRPARPRAARGRRARARTPRRSRPTA